ncbi:CorA family divalent cation transporter [Algivirga pacifica]|uniref:Magnesium/cobalt transporter CorA n=1 Tax=Algivirga pacifica TaxID=1162670 RepID=A0ABP9DK39_9BACT
MPLIELVMKGGYFRRLNRIQELSSTNLNNVFLIQVVDGGLEEYRWLEDTFQINLQPFYHREDIEISSRYSEEHEQLAISIDVPFSGEDNHIQETYFHVIFKDGNIFSFNNMKAFMATHRVYQVKKREISEADSSEELFLILIQHFTDYYADLIQVQTARIKKHVYRIIKKQEYSTSADLDMLMAFGFDNILLKESVLELQQIMLMLRRSKSFSIDMREAMDSELRDLRVLNDHIRYNFERIDDLKENINSKIDLAQNKLIKLLTVITFCLSPPTLIAGIYGMNFSNMPELHWAWGYPFAIVLMLSSVAVPLLYFYKKKWL